MFFTTCANKRWAPWVSIILWAIRVVAQSSTTPVISQMLRLYNDSGSMETTHFPVDVVISSDFQIVNAVGEGNLSDWRFLFDYSYSCNSSNFTFDSIQQSNNNNLLYPPIRNEAIVALIQRGGECKWSEKLSMARNLSYANGINLGAVLIVSNITESSPQYSRYEIGLLNDTIQLPIPIPSERNISNMLDNDIQGTANIPTYFIPKSYGDYLRTLVVNSTAQSDSSRALYQLNFATKAYWIQPSNASGNKMSGTYIACIVVLVSIFIAAIVTGILFLRWWRRRQAIEELEYETQLREYAANMQLRMKARPLPIALVNALPISKYSPDIVKNNSCVICFDDYVVDENELRILGCGHGFCTACIDPWLTKKSTKCPICKYDCMPPKHQRQISPSTQPVDSPANQEQIPGDDPQSSAGDEVRQTTICENSEHDDITSDADTEHAIHGLQRNMHIDSDPVSSNRSPIIDHGGHLSVVQTIEGGTCSLSSDNAPDDTTRMTSSEAVAGHKKQVSANDTEAVASGHLQHTAAPVEILDDVTTEKS
ncbi:hypothetical protein BX666DRAFT_1901718 [Dichotomocladium elegans]|nr:hypothetical protein BX666DRAFT_1901718 [Dichotomocladium elegans]